MLPTTRYAQSGRANIAYQVLGEGEVDLLMVSGWVSHLEHLWEAAPARRALERLAQFSRLIVYDQRASGLSDDLDADYSLEQDTADAIAVLDAVGSERAAIYARWTGGALGVTLAAEHPERVAALVLYAAAARFTWAPDYEWALKPDQRKQLVETSTGEWGEARNREMERWAPSVLDDPAMVEWFARQQRLMATPGKARIRWEANAGIDVRAQLPRIAVRTLVMRRREDQAFDPRHSEYLAEHIPDARYVVLDGNDVLDFLGDSDAIAEEIEEFLTGVRSGAKQRELLTLMFTDIVDSTRRAAELGDRRWRDLLAAHDEAVRREIARFGGREVKTMGDGFLVAFAGLPSAAVRCGQQISAAVRQLGIEARVGLHTGECELTDGDVGGMAVHVASRVISLAGPSEIAASASVAAALAGSPFGFDEDGVHELKGVPGRWPVYVLRPSAA